MFCRSREFHNYFTCIVVKSLSLKPSTFLVRYSFLSNFDNRITKNHNILVSDLSAKLKTSPLFPFWQRNHKALTTSSTCTVFICRSLVHNSYWNKKKSRLVITEEINGKIAKNSVVECIFEYMALHFGCRCNKNSLLQCYFLMFFTSTNIITSTKTYTFRWTHNSTSRKLFIKENTNQN